jgi:hypothetical protein
LSGFEVRNLTQPNLADIRGTAEIDGTSGFLRLRWVYYDDQGDLPLNEDGGSWQLAVVAPTTFIVDEDGERLNWRLTCPNAASVCGQTSVAGDQSPDREPPRFFYGDLPRSAGTDLAQVARATRWAASVSQPDASCATGSRLMP